MTNRSYPPYPTKPPPPSGREREFHLQLRLALLPIMAYIEFHQLHRTDAFAEVVRRGFGQVVRWVEKTYDLPAENAAGDTHEPKRRG